jgi:hypothetical protein
MRLPDLLAWATWRDIGYWADMEHLVLAFIGENGEMAEILKKERFKPGWTMPPFARIDELCDLWYYIRILGIYSNESAVEVMGREQIYDKQDLWGFHLTTAYFTARLGAVVAERRPGNTSAFLREFCQMTKSIAAKFDWSIEELTLLNWLKLCNGKHGWPDKNLVIPSPEKIMKALDLDLENFEQVYAAHRTLGRILDREWAEYVFGDAEIFYEKDDIESDNKLLSQQKRPISG